MDVHCTVETRDGRRGHRRGQAQCQLRVEERYVRQQDREFFLAFAEDTPKTDIKGNTNINALPTKPTARSAQ